MRDRCSFDVILCVRLEDVIYHDELQHHELNFSHLQHHKHHESWMEPLPCFSVSAVNPSLYRAASSEKMLAEFIQGSPQPPKHRQRLQSPTRHLGSKTVQKHHVTSETLQPKRRTFWLSPGTLLRRSSDFVAKIIWVLITRILFWGTISLGSPIFGNSLLYLDWCWKYLQEGLKPKALNPTVAFFPIVACLCESELRNQMVG